MKKLLFSLSVGALLAISACAFADNTINIGTEKTYQAYDYTNMSIAQAGDNKCSACHSQAVTGKSVTAMTLERTTKSVKPSEEAGIFYHETIDGLTLLAVRWH